MTIGIVNYAYKLKGIQIGLVNIVRDVGRVGQTLKWDPVAERFTNCDEANKLLVRPRRKGYELPKLS